MSFILQASWYEYCIPVDPLRTARPDEGIFIHERQNAIGFIEPPGNSRLRKLDCDLVDVSYDVRFEMHLDYTYGSNHLSWPWPLLFHKLTKAFHNQKKNCTERRLSHFIFFKNTSPTSRYPHKSIH